MSEILNKILATKRDEVASAKRRVSFDALRSQALESAPPRDFLAAIAAKHATGKPAVIAEIKRASPSAGEFRSKLGSADTFSAARFATSYERNGAACLSVLTDRDYFKGSREDLVAARAACGLPVLRKDFIVDPYQIVEARAMGADAVLFIIGAASIDQFIEWELLAFSLGMAVLAESHSGAELEDALKLKTPLIGVNNRDLNTFLTKVDTTLKLKSMVPQGRIIVSESGIDNEAIVEAMLAEGVSTFLIGGALMSHADPGLALRDLFGKHNLA